MSNCGSVLILCVAFVSGINWDRTSRLKDFDVYFTKVIQETVYEVERREWCNLKLDNVYQTINDALFNFHVNGTVVYRNGFLISIQKLDITAVQDSISQQNRYASVYGNLNIHDAKVGFDVIADLSEQGVNRFTGTFLYSLIQFQLTIRRDLDTHEYTIGSSLLSLSGGSGVRMIYMPANRISEALSRRWAASNAFAGVGKWGSEVMALIIKNITNDIPFPEICLGCLA